MKRGRKNKKTRGFGDVSSGRLLEALKLLAEGNCRYLIVGGVAANLHGLSRGTKDIDVLIPKDLQNAQNILDALGNLTWGIAREISAEKVISKPFTIIGDFPRVDLLLNAGKVKFDEAYKNRETVTIEGIKIPFISIDDLIKSKDTDRPNDAVILKEIKRLKKI